MNYFLLNKQQDYECGICENGIYTNDGFTLADIKKKAVFISRLYDTQEKDCSWSRILMKESSALQSAIQISFYSAETAIDYEEIAHQPLNIEEKKAAWQADFVKTLLCPKDSLLFEMRGRYGWLVIELYPQISEAPKIESIQLVFEQNSWINYLPSIYQEAENSFLNRFLTIFQTIYEESEQKIRTNEYLLDPQATTSEFLYWIAQWLDIQTTHLWEESRLRQFIARSAELFQKRGTRAGLIDLVSLYLEDEVYLTEYHQLKKNARYDQLEKLYQCDENTFYLFVHEDRINSEKEYRALLNIVNEVKPAHMDVIIISLKNYLFMGNHTYL